MIHDKCRRASSRRLDRVIGAKRMRPCLRSASLVDRTCTHRADAHMSTEKTAAPRTCTCAAGGGAVVETIIVRLMSLAWTMAFSVCSPSRMSDWGQHGLFSMWAGTRMHQYCNKYLRLRFSASSGVALCSAARLAVAPMLVRSNASTYCGHVPRTCTSYSLALPGTSEEMGIDSWGIGHRPMHS